MFIVEIKKLDVWTDSSSHTKSGDADAQKQRFVSAGIPVDDIRITEKDTFSPVQE